MRDWIHVNPVTLTTPYGQLASLHLTSEELIDLIAAGFVDQLFELKAHPADQIREQGDRRQNARDQ